MNGASAMLFFAWYTYAPGGAAAGAAGQRWFTGQGSFAPGLRSIPVTLYATTGGVFDSSATAPHSDAVGTATLAFQNCSHATLSYTFTGGCSSGMSGDQPGPRGSDTDSLRVLASRIVLGERRVVRPLDVQATARRTIGVPSTLPGDRNSEARDQILQAFCCT